MGRLTRRTTPIEVGALPLVATAILAAAPAGCTSEREGRAPAAVTTADDAPLRRQAAPDAAPREASGPDDQRRSQMIGEQLVARDIVDRRVLDAMQRVPRHEFVPERQRHLAYQDGPLPIGHGQTISQPYIVALMTQLVEPKPAAKALDVGTGSGYQAAVLAELVKEVYSIEIIEPLATAARGRLRDLGYQNIEVRQGDGYLGWPEEAPFDVIIVAAAPDHVPPALVEQLSRGGKLVVPVGRHSQRLLVVEKAEDGAVSHRKVASVAFVPMTREPQD